MQCYVRDGFEIEESCSINALAKRWKNKIERRKKKHKKDELSNCAFYNLRLLTLFLHVTSTRYFVSGQRDNSTLAVSVNRLPINPPP